MFNKKILYLVICILFTSVFLVGCNTKTKKHITKKKPIVKEEYKDLNNMPIGIYDNTNNKLTLLTEYSNKFVRGTDIGVFSIFPSKEKEIILNKKYAEEFYNKWSSLSKNNKIGFNIKFDLNDGTSFSYNVLNPSETMLHAEYLEIYLYDDYAHRNDSFYSHVETKDYNDNTLFTAIKLTPGRDIDKVKSPIKLTVFTYDSEDDFNFKKEYRGHSKYSIDVKRTN